MYCDTYWGFLSNISKNGRGVFKNNRFIVKIPIYGPVLDQGAILKIRCAVTTTPRFFTTPRIFFLYYADRRLKSHNGKVSQNFKNNFMQKTVFKSDKYLIVTPLLPPLIFSWKSKISVVKANFSIVWNLAF